MRFPPLLISLSAFLLCRYIPAQPADVDALSHDLDLSILKNQDELFDELSDEEIPADHLFIGFDKLGEIPEPENDQWSPIADSPLILLDVPARSYLVVPNPARMYDAYTLLVEGLKDKTLEAVFPLNVLLHADGNFSLAVALREPPTKGLSQGLDISPVAKTVFAGVEADIQFLRKSHLPVLEAFTLLRTEAEKLGLELDRSELYFFPHSPGKVLLALPVKAGYPIGKTSKTE